MIEPVWPKRIECGLKERVSRNGCQTDLAQDKKPDDFFGQRRNQSQMSGPAFVSANVEFAGDRRDQAPTLYAATSRRALMTLGVFLALLMVCDRPLSSQSAPVEGKIDIGGYSLWIQCSGVGRPTVVLDAGMGDPGDWKAII